MSEKLKPCPFCGIIKHEHFELPELRRCATGGYNAICDECGAKGQWGKTVDETTANWNRRASAWISVDDRLPQRFVTVIVDGPYGVRTAYISVDTDIGPDELRWETSCGNRYSMDEVRNWQPLPDPPEVTP